MTGHLPTRKHASEEPRRDHKERKKEQDDKDEPDGFADGGADDLTYALLLPS